MNKSVVVMLVILALMGCSTLTVVAPDGTTLKYNSFMGTTDNLKTGGTIPVEFKGKQTIDPATVQAILGGALAK